MLIQDPHWEFPREDLEIGESLGKGEFGLVFKAVAKNIKDFKGTLQSLRVNNYVSSYSICQNFMLGTVSVIICSWRNRFLMNKSNFYKQTYIWVLLVVVCVFVNENYFFSKSINIDIVHCLIWKTYVKLNVLYKSSVHSFCSTTCKNQSIKNRLKILNKTFYKVTLILNLFKRKSYGYCYLFILSIVTGNTVVAVKTPKNNKSDSQVEDLLSEYNLMKKVSHPNVVMLLGACTSPGPLYVIIEFAEHGCLQ